MTGITWSQLLQKNSFLEINSTGPNILKEIYNVICTDSDNVGYLPLSSTEYNSWHSFKIFSFVDNVALSSAEDTLDLEVIVFLNH